MTTTILKPSELDEMLVSLTQEQDVKQAVESFNQAFATHSLPLIPINAAFIGDVHVPAAGDSVTSTKEKLLARLSTLSDMAEGLAALKAEYEAEGGEYPKHVRGRPTATLMETARLFPDLIRLN